MNPDVLQKAKAAGLNVNVYLTYGTYMSPIDAACTIFPLDCHAHHSEYLGQPLLLTVCTSKWHCVTLTLCLSNVGGLQTLHFRIRTSCIGQVCPCQQGIKLRFFSGLTTLGQKTTQNRKISDQTMCNSGVQIECTYI